MSTAGSDDLARRLLPQPWHWVSGPYLYEPGPWMSFIVIRSTPEVMEISVYDYTVEGLGPMEMICRKRLVHPLDSEVAYLYSMESGWGPDLEREIAVAEAIADIDAEDSDLEEIEAIGKTYCRFFEPMIPLADSGRCMEDLDYVDPVRFEQKWPGLKDQETPAFW